VTWAENGSIVGASSAGANDAVEIAFETAGLGHLEYDIGSGEQTLDCAPVFNVKAAPAKRFRITNQNGAPGEVATNPFWMKIELVDQFGNLRNDITGDIDLNISASAG